MIVLEDISKRIGGRTLFENVTISFTEGNRYGLTGPNGSGKSTLLRMMMGVEECTTGTVSLPDRVGFLRQDLEHFHDVKVLDAVIMGNKRLWDALTERQDLENAPMDDAVGMRLAQLEETIMEEDGYTAESSAEELLAGLGIPESFYQGPMRDLAVDLQFRVLIGQALFGRPQALLLDEPTNHLDLESIRWLEDFLKNYHGTLVTVSHDRHFLNSVATHIADIDYETLIIYPGNYDDMLVAKTDATARAQADIKSKERKIAQLREFVARFGAGTRASQVQSRIREIDRLQPQDLKKSNIQRPYIRFDAPQKQAGQIVFELKKVCKSYGGPMIINKLSCEIQRGDRVGVIGNNGRGKTTLLKILAGKLPIDSGLLKLGNQVEIGYFPQLHGELVERNPNETAFNWLKQRRSGILDEQARSSLGRMLFGGDDAFKPLSALSGGETARLIFAGLMLMPHNTLILDEPNNHLDLESVSALSQGLCNYQGTVVVASHDRNLLSAVATKIIAFESDGVQFYDGPLEEYLAKRAALA
jgi:ATPase subunit of ABC transporter with duplicated ATPase domains